MMAGSTWLSSIFGHHGNHGKGFVFISNRITFAYLARVPEDRRRWEPAGDLIQTAKEISDFINGSGFSEDDVMRSSAEECPRHTVEPQRAQPLRVKSRIYTVQVSGGLRAQRVKTRISRTAPSSSSASEQADQLWTKTRQDSKPSSFAKNLDGPLAGEQAIKGHRSGERQHGAVKLALAEQRQVVDHQVA